MRATPFWLAFTLSLLCAGAQAQWQWVDKDGRKVYSDLPPPADIAEKNILKRPGKAVAANAPASATAPGAADAAPPSPTSSAPPKKSELDKKLEEKKKQADKEAAAKRKAEEERVAAARAENCRRARESLSNYESGMRIARLNNKGEREFLDDAARAAETRRLQGIVQQDCR